MYPRLFRRLGHARLVAVVARRFGARADRALYRATGGKLAMTGPAVAPVLLLTTTGRRTGRKRTTPVIYIQDEQKFVVSSEDFGQQRPAAWPLNLDARPTASIQIGRRIMICDARRLSDEEADRYWPQLIEAWPAHATYRSRNGRRHTFLLEPHPQLPLSESH